MTGKAEPRFDIDFKYGRQGELQIGGYLEWIATGNANIEVKTKRYIDPWFYIETSCDKGRSGVYAPSGIAVTTAKVWAFNIAETGIAVLIPTEYVRIMLEDGTTRDKAEPDGSCPTKGRLISLVVLLAKLKAGILDADPKVSEKGKTEAESFAQGPVEISEIYKRYGLRSLEIKR